MVKKYGTDNCNNEPVSAISSWEASKVPRGKLYNALLIGILLVLVSVLKFKKLSVCSNLYKSIGPNSLHCGPWGKLVDSWDNV